MAIRTITHTDAVGGTFYAYPGRTSNTYSLANWTTHRVDLVENDKLEDNGVYQGNVDDDKGAVWYIFEGATQPSDWGQAVAVVDFTGEQTNTEIGKVHRSATAVAAGASMRRTKAAATSTTLDETLGATP